MGPRPSTCDVLIAFRKPELLDFVSGANRRLLWLATPIGYLEAEGNPALLDVHRPTLVFLGASHRTAYRNGAKALHAEIIQPGIGSAYLDFKATAPRHPPYAVATSHPHLGLEWLVKLWSERVHPACPHAELRLYSAALHRIASGGAVLEPFRSVAAAALAARDKGVAIYPPASDPEMAEAYRGARAHLYPGDRREVYCHTLAESQAAGLPAVARPFPAIAELVEDQASGKLVADDEAFARGVLSLLEDDETHQRMSEKARERSAGRSWDKAAAAFEAVMLR
ncbi:MAG TPA: glycosyltransferase [Alphaproteobacteria bacterium]|nr:glycosyltransferase [Alphaproteobacteria bacterium]